MKILAHRGYWNKDIAPNTKIAIETALKNGFGFESDVRDYLGKMVISHNIADNNSFDAEYLFELLHKYNDEYCFAINIKADGLKEILKKYIDKYNISNYFLFDMSIPQMVEFKEMGLRFFTRQSEVEPSPNMYDDASGVWIDGFWSIDWITEDLLVNHINNKKIVCLVSPDLHGKDNYKEFWSFLKKCNIDFNKVFLCTDHPDEAKEFFYGK